MRFRPDDGYCKPACGNRHATTSFLLRVRVKKSRILSYEQNSEELQEKQKKLNKDLEDLTLENKTSNSETLKGSENNLINIDSIDLDNAEGEATERNINGETKNIAPTFNPNLYENLSQDVNYELPKLKVLGKIQTEYRFTSKTNEF